MTLAAVVNVTLCYILPNELDLGIRSMILPDHYTLYKMVIP